MRLGIFVKTFAGTDPAAVLAAAAAAGYETTQFNLACAGLASMPDAVPADVIAGIGAASASTGVSLAALSGTYNMAHPDPAVRDDGLHRLAVVLGAARALDIPLVTLCTGTRHPTDQWAHHPDNSDASAWGDMAAEMAKALDLAERQGVDLGIEPEQANIVTSAADAVRLAAEMGSPRLRVVLDPANLFEAAGPDEARRIVAKAVDEAAPLIAMAHAKDRYPDGRFATAGRGVVDFPDFLRRLRAVGFDGPLVTHGLAAEEAGEVAAFLRGALR
ncbi:sugar phosphate isomerase/epimerase family protein [Aureimonas pseudogalii]|uniref:Sugar phosphate isomerase/epimerase n=1 Tax=Aureimonas pseudogalii TaxID=1744844 RepID=A0A7W6EH04_9HYPH|nr:sugar phosphate isomerase/epimerase family protein [Aureimonas pseudogalii]MBB3997874.1 sugar phosphate isomerase/epimerase [Aureimonas pseudogalii]